MAPQKIVSGEKSMLEKDGRTQSNSNASEQSIIAPAVPASVIIKLLGFTAAMIGGPIGVYFLTINTIFRGSSTYAGATAAFTANAVLIAYVIVAMKEDQSERLAAEEDTKKKK